MRWGAHGNEKEQKSSQEVFFCFVRRRDFFLGGHVWRRNLKGTIRGGIFLCVRGAAGVENHRNEPISGSERSKLHVLERTAQ